MVTIQEVWQQFVALIGQPVETEDPTALDHCMDLAFKWCDLLGIDRATIRHPYAFQVFTQPLDITLQFFELIPNTPNGKPNQGDLVIFNANVPLVTSGAGHICVATGEGDSNSFKSLDQNWNSVKHVTQETHSYTGVLGWLRLRPPLNTVELDQLRKERDDNWNLYQAGLEVNKQLQTQLNETQAQVTDLQNQLTTCLNKPPTIPPTPPTLPPDQLLSEQLATCRVDLQATANLSTFRFNVLQKIKGIATSEWWFFKMGQVRSTLSENNI